MSWSIKPLGDAVQPEPEAPRITSENYRHSIVESTYQPERVILSQDTGTPRICLYYHQWLGRDEEPKPFTLEGVGTYQSYERIEKLPLLLDDGNGSFSFNPQTAEAEKKYVARVVFDRVPTIHDVFVMDIADGNAGLFAITDQPEFREVTANKKYEFQFTFLGIMTEQHDVILESRVVRRQVYYRDSALNGGRTLISGTLEQTAKELFGWKTTIAQYIMSEFYWNPENTIVFDRPGTPPGKTEKIYDPYLVNFLTAVITPDMRGRYPFINQFSLQYGGLEDARYGPINIWTFLLRHDMNVLPLCNRKAKVIDVNRVEATRLYGNLRSSRIRHFITTNPEDFKKYSAYINVDGYPILKPSPEYDISYMFSEGFYTGHPTGEFEEIVYSSYRDQMIDHERLLKYVKDYFKLTPMERLYHGAILIRLIDLSRKIQGPL
jgi:hypothetical protein